MPVNTVIRNNMPIIIVDQKRILRNIFNPKNEKYTMGITNKEV
jgi:hypothetical protein